MFCKSSIKKIRIAARHLLALAAEELQPHLDLVIAKNVYANLVNIILFRNKKKPQAP